MAGQECYHCKQIIKDYKSHDCWTTTEEALTRDLNDDLFDAWERIRETATGFGEQRIYASHKSIMFSRKACYFFVRPKKNYLEVCFFVGRTIKDPLIMKSAPSSKIKVGHLLRIRHRDEVEFPITDWLSEAYRFSEEASSTKIETKKKPSPKQNKKKKKGKKK